jgi:hypothetical protein
MQPEAQKLNEAEQRKLQENLRNYTSIVKKLTVGPRVPPLYLCNHSIFNPILLHVLKHISTEQHKQIQAGNKYKISKKGILPTSISYNYPIVLTVLLPAFKELLIACQRCVQFLSKVRKVATRLMDRDFIHLKNKVATGEWVCSPFP